MYLEPRKAIEVIADYVRSGIFIDWTWIDGALQFSTGIHESGHYSSVILLGYLGNAT